MASPDAAQLPSDGSGDIVFEHTMRGMLELGGDRFSAESRARLKSLGVDPAALLPAYPADHFRQVLNLVRVDLYGEMTVNQGYAEIGRAYFKRYEQTVVGRALLLAVKVLGARRTIDRMARNFRTANNYTECRVTERAPGVCEVWFNRVIHPHYYRGLLDEALSRAGVEEQQVKLLSHGPEGAVFELSWKAS